MIPRAPDGAEANDMLLCNTFSKAFERQGPL